MTRFDRRRFTAALVGLLSSVLPFDQGDAEAGQRRPAVRRARRRVRRRVRRRIRRRVVSRVVLGRRVWVAPVALAIGWQLALAPNRVVVVTETKFVERAGTRIEVAVVQGTDGKIEELEIVREDTDENRKDLEGSILPDADKTTPGIETEAEVEVDDDKQD